MIGPARMVHPGPRADDRVQAVPATLQAISGRLSAGQTVMEAVGNLFTRNGCRGGVLRLDGTVCAPMRYVLPALSTDGLHAAWYSDMIAPDGPMRILSATATVGEKDGAPFLHCHGIWAGDDGVSRMGHLLPFDSLLAANVRVTGIGSPDAWFENLPDAETAFSLFQPKGHGRGGILARLRPGENTVTTIQTLCSSHGISDARIHGVGSIDHIRFQDGSRVNCLATELHFSGAQMINGRAVLPIEVVDIHGHIHSGTLADHDNPVGVTIEIIIEPQEQT